MKRKIVVILLIILSLLLISYHITQAQNQKTPKPSSPVEIEKQTSQALKSGKILLNFEDIDVKVLAKIISEITGKNILVDEKLTGKITIISARPVSSYEAWKIFVSALNAKGYSVVDKGTYVKILPSAEAKTQRLKVLGEKDIHPAEDLVVAVVVLKNAEAEKIKNSLASLISPEGYITAYEPTNSLVIADTSSNISRISKIIKHLDIYPQKLQLRIYHPKNISVDDLVDSIEKVMGGQTVGVQSDFKISAYEPTNSVLVVGTQQQILRVEKIIGSLDKSRELTGRKFQIYYLENADGEQVAATISTMLGEKQKLLQKGEAQDKETLGQGGEGKSKEFISTKVSSDKATNSVICYVTDSEYEVLKEMIKKLDAPRKQILVSAVVVEVSLNKLVDIGVRWQAMYKKGATSFEGGLSQQALYGVLASGNFIFGAVGEGTTTVTDGGNQVTYPNVFYLISALQQDSDFNILSAPRLVTLDHQEAKMKVGSVYPYASGVKYDTNQNPVVTYDYKDVGLDLKITPHISQSQLIRMEIYQKLQEITDTLRPTVGQVQYIVPVTSQREFDTTVTVNDNQTIIIGGLISKKTLQSIKKLPILGDLPLIGAFFREKSTRDEKITLFVFITPHVITKSEQLQAISQEYEKIIKKEIEQQKIRKEKPWEYKEEELTPDNIAPENKIMNQGQDNTNK